MGGENPYKSLCGLVNHAVLWGIFLPGLDQNNKHTWNCQEHPKRKQNYPKTNKIQSNIILRKNAEKLTQIKHFQGCCQEYGNGNKVYMHYYFKSRNYRKILKL